MTLPTLIAQLKIDGWIINGATEDSFRASREYQLSLNVCKDNTWELGRFTDSDMETDQGAVGRYQTIDEGEHLHEIMEAIRCAELVVERTL